MPEVTFDEEQSRPIKQPIRKNRGVTGFLIKHNWADSEKKAQKILLLICGICLVMAFLISVSLLYEGNTSYSDPNYNKLSVDEAYYE